MNYLKTMKVLYVEDEEGILEQVSSVLSFFFKDVITARDGKEAFLKYEECKPDMFIFDICIPEIDGLELLRQIRLKDKEIPVIMLTAHTENPYLLRAVELNITRYLVKPFSKESLLEALRECSKIIFSNKELVVLENDYKFNYKTKVFTYQEEAIQLTANELKLIELMCLQYDKVHEFDFIIESIWGWEDISKEALKSLVKGLRKKLPKPLINNVFGVGYTLRSID